MTNGGDNQEWRDFLRTLDVLTASAKADLEAGEASGPQWRPAFTAELLAAAQPEGVKLPETEILCEGNELAVQIASSDFELRVALQLQGFSALDQYGGQEARVVSANGAIDYRVRFSASGSAICMLANKPKIREGLGKFSVLFQTDRMEDEA
jgi:hypothetical protein